MSKLIIPVGIPGCGKSTFADFLNHADLDIIETDAIRADFVKAGKLSAVNDMSRNKEVFEIYHEMIGAALTAERDVFADATNLQPFARSKLRNIAKEVGGVATHVIVFTNLSTAVARNARRAEGRIVPPEAMCRMLEQYEKALVDIPTEEYTWRTYIENVS